MDNKPRFREIIEGAAGNITATIILAILGITTGGVVIGWFPTFIIFTIVIGVFSLWYRFDPNLQGLIRQRFFKMRHAISGHSIVMSRWNLITEETINYVVRQNKLIRDKVTVEQSRIFKINSQDHLELVINYVDNIKYLSLTNSVGTVLDTYGGFKAVAGECKNCNALILVRYVDGKDGKPLSELSTTCRRCRFEMSLSVVSFDQQMDFYVKIKSIDKNIIEVKDGKLNLHIEFTMQNLGKTTQVRPHLELKISVKQGVKWVDRIAKKDLSPIEIQSNSQKTKSLDWIFPITTVILSQKEKWLSIELRPV